MTDPCPEALEIARQVADSWRADGRLGQLESHIAPAIQKLIEAIVNLKTYHALLEDQLDDAERQLSDLQRATDFPP